LFSYVGVVDRGIREPRQDQGGEDAHFVAERSIGTFRGVANVDYLSSFVFPHRFTDVYTQAINSEVRSQIFLSNTTRDFTSMPSPNATRISKFAFRNRERPQVAAPLRNRTDPEPARAKFFHLG